jgi:hypothetical protein
MQAITQPFLTINASKNIAIHGSYNAHTMKEVHTKIWHAIIYTQNMKTSMKREVHTINGRFARKNNNNQLKTRVCVFQITKHWFHLICT